MDEGSVARSFLTTLALFVAVAAVALPVAVWRLRGYHRPVWEALAATAAGRPRPLVVAWRLIRFAVSPRHLGMTDLTLSLACVAFLLGVLAVLVGFIGWMQALFAAG
jgi:hypothetical protein